MRFALKGITYNNLIFFDIEYDRNYLIQFAALKLTKVKAGVFELTESINLYIKPPFQVSRFFSNYTGITNDFLQKNGIYRNKAIEIIQSLLDTESSLIVSHGIQGDLNVLRGNGVRTFDLKTFCTYTKAKAKMNRDTNLTLKDLCNESCYFIYNEHNAFSDAWGTLAAFSYLNSF